MVQETDIVTKLGDGNRLLGELIKTIKARETAWDLGGTLSIAEGGTGSTTESDARTALGLAIGSDVQAYIAYLNNANLPVRSLGFVFGDGVTAIATGEAGDLWMPFACTINEAVLLADQTGSIVVDIWKVAIGSYPPTNANSITASAPPTISSDDNSSDSTLTGWTTSISAGDTLRFNVDSATTVTRVTLQLKVTLA